MGWGILPMNDKDYITVKGARENNLKNVDVSIPKNKLVVFTGVSGCGKSTLAFDTIYSEGRRRYIESLSSYARQFLGDFEKPDVDEITGLSPAISIDQKTTSHNPRSTVGTVTEIYDYLRLLFARIGVAYCPNHHRPIKAYSVEQMAERIKKFPLETKVTVMAPVVRNEKGTHIDTIQKFFKSGFNRIKIDGGEIVRYAAPPLLDKGRKHTLEFVIDRLTLKEDSDSRLLDSLRVALNMANGYVKVLAGDEEMIFSEHSSCPECGFTIPQLEPRLFSFNNPLGCCPDCNGLGVQIKASLDLIVPNDNLSINQGAIAFYKNKEEHTIEMHDLRAVMKEYGIPGDVPFRKLSAEHQRIIIEGPDKPVEYIYKSVNGSMIRKSVSEGIMGKIERLYNSTNSDDMKKYYYSFMREHECKTCRGTRLNEQVLAVKVGGLSIADVCALPLAKLKDFLIRLDLSPTEAKIGAMVLNEIKHRVQFLIDVGLNYLTLDRTASTLSGGESQRIRLATQIGSHLSGVLYVLDEPSIGLHQRDNDRLIATLKEMRDLGNSLIVVEHDEDTMRAADYIVDIGPGAGDHGGKIVAAGPLEEIMKSPESITGQYLNGTKKIAVPDIRRVGYGELFIRGARCHNLKNIDVAIPLGVFTCVTGVSGSGKSSLVTEILYKTIRQHLGLGKDYPGECDGVDGLDKIDKVINVSQEPIGRTPRSNPATYIKVFDDIRELYALAPEARALGFSKSMFSFNNKGGRCEVCQGEGVRRISMNFLPDVFVECEVCHGKRYGPEALSVTYKGKNIYDVLEMRAEEAYEFFSNIPTIARKIKTLIDVGLGYIKLGQNSTTLSGGEAQRVKLAYQLQKCDTGGTLYILDEPTTGLHSDDVSKLLGVIDRIVGRGNTVVVIEHNLDVIKCADYIVDLGPEGGDEGGQIVALGTPEAVAAVKESYTGHYLGRLLANS